MNAHDFTELYSHYPTTISNMKNTFTSHEFILKLAQQHQALYIEALYSYRKRIHREELAPFLMVHGILAKHLNVCSDLIEQIRKNKPSKNIYGQVNTCSEWQK